MKQLSKDLNKQFQKLKEENINNLKKVRNESKKMNYYNSTKSQSRIFKFTESKILDIIKYSCYFSMC